MTHFRDIRYTAGLTYGEMLLQNEYEMSCYNLDHANVAAQRQLFTLFQQARRRALGMAQCVQGCACVFEHLQEPGVTHAVTTCLSMKAFNSANYADPTNPCVLFGCCCMVVCPTCSNICLRASPQCLYT